jgi:hypothetical protein
VDEWSERSDQNGPDDDSMPSAEADSSKKFNLESLEPRILLSGDPVVAELARLAQSATDADASDTPSVIVEELDAALQSEMGLTTTASDESDGAQVAVVWPAGWDTSSDENGAESGVIPGSDFGAEEVAEIAPITSAESDDNFRAPQTYVSGPDFGAPIEQISGDETASKNASADTTPGTAIEAAAEAVSESNSDDVKDVVDNADDSSTESADVVSESGTVLQSSNGASESGPLATPTTPTVGSADTLEAGRDLNLASASEDASADVPEITMGGAGESLESSSDTDRSSDHDDGADQITDGAMSADDGHDAVAATAVFNDAQGDETASTDVTATDLDSLHGDTADHTNIADDGLATTDLMVGIVAAAHRTQESNRSSRSELRRSAGKGADDGADRSVQGTPATESDVAASEEINDDSIARGPPAIYESQTVSEDAYTDTVRREEAVFVVSDSEALEIDRFDTVLARGPPADDASPRAPPAHSDSGDYLFAYGTAADSGDATALTEEQLGAVLDEALRIWSAFLTNADQLNRLDSITVEITDLPDGILGEARGTTIYLDITAAGHGWFVDATADDSSEFGIILDGERLIADSASDAFGRIDLLTVLVHEIGHGLGFDHDSGLAVMDDALRNGERVLLGSDTAVAMTSGSVTAAVSAGGGVLTIEGADTGPITLTIVDSDSNTTADIAVTGAADPLHDITYDNIVSIVGNSSAQVVLVVPDSLVLNFTGADAGTFDGVSYDPVSFSAIGDLAVQIVGGSGHSLDIALPSGNDDASLAWAEDISNYENFVLDSINAGFPDTLITLSSNIDDVSIELGAGNDIFTIGYIPLGWGNTQSFEVRGLTGDDAITLDGVDNVSSAFTIDGGADNDSITIGTTEPIGTPSVFGVATTGDFSGFA